MKFEEVVTSPMADLFQEYVDNHTSETTFKALLTDNTDRTHLYIGEDVIIIPAAKQRIFEGNFGLKYMNAKHRLQIGNWLIYKATDETIADIIAREVENA
jgi:hypothetical protein